MKDIRTKEHLWTTPEALGSLSMTVAPRSALSVMGPAVIIRSALDELRSRKFTKDFNLARLSKTTAEEHR